MADFWAGYLSGVAGILVGSPLDIIKTRSQSQVPASVTAWCDEPSSLIRGTAAPILAYGALNALMFYTYNRSLEVLGVQDQPSPNLWKVWLSGAIGGLACFVISTPTEVIKCRSQVTNESSWGVAKDLFQRYGIKGLYLGGVVTSLRDSVGFGFYFWAYEGLKRYFPIDSNGVDPSSWTPTINTLLCGGTAGCVSWASVYPLDVIKTQVQVQALTAFRLPTVPERTPPAETRRLLPISQGSFTNEVGNVGAWKCTTKLFREGGIKVFWNGLSVCMGRAFIVNAVTFFVYEWSKKEISKLKW
ncbi:solute carrier family 25 member 45 [Kalaharituber pfeilii]|nr:solute carrier family 25 member 45 [Kalaharituber pfeilii]